MDERRLWTAVLLQAVCDIAGVNMRVHPRERAKLQHFARLWFDSDNYEVSSFRWICDELGLSPSYLRRRLMAIINSGHMTKRDFGTRLSVSNALQINAGSESFTEQAVKDAIFM